MAINTTIRVRGISQADLETVLQILEENSKGVVLLDHFITPEEAPHGN